MYVLNRDSKNTVTISSPLEAHKSQTIVLTTEGLDVGYDNPIFACLELNYAEVDEDPTGEAAAHTEKLLTFYQLDLGLNHVIRKWSEAACWCSRRTGCCTATRATPSCVCRFRDASSCRRTRAC